MPLHRRLPALRMLRKILSGNIKLKRKLLGFTQETLAEKAELSAQTVNDIEGCRTWVSDKPLIKLAEVLHTTPADLLVPLGETETSSLPDFLKLKNELLFEVSEKIESVFTSHIEKKS